MAITDYTTYDEVRTTVGQNSQELPDSVLALEIYDNALFLAISDVTLPDEAPGPGDLDTRFAEIAAEDVADRTAKEKQLYALTRMYATYVVAAEVVVSLSSRMPKTITDSKASVTRFSSEAVFNNTIQAINKLVGATKFKIENINSETDFSYDPLTIVSPELDVITEY